MAATNTTQTNKTIKTLPEFDHHGDFTGHYYHVCTECGIDYFHKVDAKGCCK